MDMSDAFNNYCISCDKLCLPSSVYCCQECRTQDERQLISILQSCNADMTSPLLTPSLYQPQSQLPETHISSPLLLPNNINDADVRDFSLHYNVSLPVLVASATPASQNYRLWLTGVM